MQAPIMMTCQIVRVGNDIEIAYTLKNTTPQDYGLFNKIKGVRVDGTNNYSADLTYIHLHDGTLEVQKMALSLPPGLQVGGYQLPNATRIPAGDSTHESFRIPIPVRVCHPFKRAMHRGEIVADVPAVANELQFSVGFFPCTPSCGLVAEHPAFPEVLTADNPGQALITQIIVSQTVQMTPAIDVLDYRGVAWR